VTWQAPTPQVVVPPPVIGALLHPLTVLQLSMVQTLLSSQLSGGPLVQTPVWQVSVCVQASPSVHAVPSALAGFEQVPVAGLQTPTLWHWSDAVHVTELPPVQMPVWQVSVCVQASPSVQAEPSALAGFEQVPVAGLQTPTLWHWSDAVHVTPAHKSAPPQTPLVQTSEVVNGLPSSHAVPLGAFGFEHAPVPPLQTPAT